MVPKMLNNMISGSPARVNVAGDQLAARRSRVIPNGRLMMMMNVHRWAGGSTTALFTKPGCAVKMTY
jgi:hypothetical protein